MNNKKPTVIYSDEIVKIVVDETVLNLSDEENNAQQFKHDEEMAKRFGFDSHNQLKQYLEICQSNPLWAEDFGYGGFLTNSLHIQMFMKDAEGFALRVIDYNSL